MRINAVPPVTYSRLISQVQPVSKIMKITGKVCSDAVSDQSDKKTPIYSPQQTFSLSNKKNFLDVLI